MNELIQTLDQWDTSLFLCLNGMHNRFWDYFMTMYSDKFVWIPFYVAFLIVMIRNFRPKVVLSYLLVVAAIILVCDQVSSSLLKPMVERMRPSNLDNPISPMVHVVFPYRGGRYGFPSSHAANAWGISFFAILLVKRKWLTGFLVPWAVLMTYSRVYLGVHYPGDLLVGTFIGILTAVVAYQLCKRFASEATERFAPHEGSLHWASVPIIVGMSSIAVMLVASGVLTYLNIE